MKKLCVVFALIAFTLAWSASAFGQVPQGSDPNITANGVLGDVVAVDAASKQIYLKTDAGSVVVITIADSTIFRRINPSSPSADKAAPMTFAEIGAGDRLLARGKPSYDHKTLAPKMVFVSTKADLAAKQEADRAEWSRRGIVGVISAVNPQTKEITLQSRGPQGPQPVIIQAGGANVKFRRYAPDSVKFSDAKASSFQELKIGDQLRAKGDKNAEGTVFTPEEVVSGTFRTSLGTIASVSPEKNEITIKQMQGGAPLTIVVSKDSVLKQIPEDLMARMGGQRPGGGAPGGPPAQGGGAPAQGVERRVVTPGGGGGAAAAGNAPGSGGFAGARRGGPDMQQMMEMLPPTTVADLKPGRMIVVLSTEGTDPTRVTAIQLLSGIEPIVAMMSGRMGGPGGPGGGAAGLGAGAGGGLNFGFGIGQP